MADPLPPSLPALGLTTSNRNDPALKARLRVLASLHGIPFVERPRNSALSDLVGTAARALLVFEADAVVLVDAEGSLRFSPGMAHLRIKRLDAGETDDLMLRVSGLQPGESVLDCTLGLGADALVAARAVGPSGRVVGLEKSLPLALLVQQGLNTLPRHPLSASLEVRVADAAQTLQSLPNGSFDCVFFDPMFERKRPSSHAFATLRRFADHSELTSQMVHDAQRVARRVVVLKGSRYSRDFKKLGVRPEPARPNATVLWARLQGSVDSKP
jgi:16S rRNA (guanine1516-N2)-methyltransferase